MSVAPINITGFNPDLIQGTQYSVPLSVTGGGTVGSLAKPTLANSNTPSNSGSWLGNTFQAITSEFPALGGAIAVVDPAVTSMIDGVPQAASSAINDVQSGMEATYAAAVWAGKTTLSGAEAVVAPVGNVVTGVIQTGESAVTTLAWAPAIIILGIVGLIFLFPDKAKAAITATKAGALA